MTDTEYGSTSNVYDPRPQPQGERVQFEYDPRPQSPDGQMQYDYRSSGPPPGKKKMSTAALVIMIVSIVIGAAVLLSIIVAGIMYMWVISLADTEGDVSIMKLTVEDGTNENDEVGCFFLIRAERGVDINPKIHTFWVSEEGRSPQKLSFAFRDYSQDGEKIPEDGDRNATFRYDNSIKAGRWPDMPVEEDRERWNDGEFIGFDMPTEEMGIDIVEGNKYDVMIKDPNNEVIYRDTFVYKEQT